MRGAGWFRAPRRNPRRCAVPPSRTSARYRLPTTTAPAERGCRADEARRGRPVAHRVPSRESGARDSASRGRRRPQRRRAPVPRPAGNRRAAGPRCPTPARETRPTRGTPQRLVSRAPVAVARQAAHAACRPPSPAARRQRPSPRPQIANPAVAGSGARRALPDAPASSRALVRASTRATPCRLTVVGRPGARAAHDPPREARVAARQTRPRRPTRRPLT